MGKRITYALFDMDKLCVLVKFIYMDIQLKRLKIIFQAFV
jgi:hypothetical protein